MKKGILFFGILFLFGLLILSNISLICAEDLKSTGEDITKELKDASGKIDTAKEYADIGKWEYLGNEWKEAFLKNKFISKIDDILKKFNFVFKILFGQNYDFSLNLFIAICLWVFFLIDLIIILKNYSLFSEEISYLMSLLLVIAFSQLGFFKMISELIFKIIFYRDGIWRWVSFLVFLFSLAFLITLVKKIGRSIKESKERKAKEQAKMDRGVLHRETSWLKKIGDVLRE